MIKIDIEEQNILLNLILIQWYDFKHKNKPYVYKCSQLKLTEIYNFIKIKAIQDIVHIVLSLIQVTNILLISLYFSF